MIYVGDYFACGFALVLSMFFFLGKHTLNKASKLFVGCLATTAATALLDVLTCSIIGDMSLPLWFHKLANTMYFITNICGTSCIALYLFNKILEHSHSKHCMRNAMTGLSICLCIFAIIVFANWWTGWAFYFDENHQYFRGPLNGIGYYITMVQMGLVTICYMRNRKNAGSLMQRVLIQTFPVAVLCIIIQRSYPEIMLNSFIMVMVNTVLFLTFESQHPGVHALTRLNDRHRFFDELEQRMEMGENLQIFMINIKNFGMLNQKYGHIFGDELLYQFAFSLDRLIHGCGAFHMNGTVFALIISNPSPHNAEKYRSALLDLMETPINCMRESVSLEYVAVESFGMEKHAKAAEFYEMLEYAATKAYRSKNHYIRCTEELHKEMLRNWYLIDRLRAVDRAHGFRVWYQPINCRPDGSFSSMEALLRLEEPDGTIISPGELVPIAEKTNMVASLTWFVLEESCKMLKAHEELKNVTISINLPMTQMMEKGFIVRMNSVLDSYGLDHGRIGLEFTEREILENFDQIKYAMERFVNSGYHFYLDDFGAGYSNFNCLLQLPFENIKLDMALIRMDIGSDGQERLGLVRTLTQYLHSLNLTVIAEGIDTQQMAQALEEIGVDKIQGFYYAKPMPEELLLAFYRE